MQFECKHCHKEFEGEIFTETYLTCPHCKKESKYYPILPATVTIGIACDDNSEFDFLIAYDHRYTDEKDIYETYNINLNKLKYKGLQRKFRHSYVMPDALNKERELCLVRDYVKNLPIKELVDKAISELNNKIEYHKDKIKELKQ